MVFSSHICTIILILCVMLVYRRQLYIRTRSNKLFEMMLFCLIGLSLFNVLLLILGDSPDFLSDVFFNLIVRLFGVFLISYVFSIQDYLFCWMHIQQRKSRFILRGALCALVAVLPVSVQFIQGGISFSGVGTIVAFDIVVAVIMYMYIIIYIHRDMASDAIKQSILFFSGIVLFSIIVNYLWGINFVDFACAIGSFWLFYNIENPKAKVDDVSGFFTSHVILDYLDSFPDQSAHIGVIYTREECLDVDFLKQILKNRKICCFRDADSFYYLVSKNFKDIVDILNEYRQSYDVVMLTYKNATSDVFSVISGYVKQNVPAMNESSIYEIVEEDLRKVNEDNRVHLEIMSALMENRIETYIQPIYSIDDNMFVSGECLCRLREKNGEVMAPQEFIPIAERTGLITEIETIMFRNMCKCLSDPRIRNSHIRYLEANLSVKKGEQQGLLEEYSKIIREYGVSSEKVNLEITETDVIEEKLNILNNMHAMQSMGFNFSLDDFGTGESNIGYIIDMPVSVIKFDKEITQKAMIDKRAFTVVQSVIDMAHSLGIKIVVEGVESQSDYDACVDMGADFIQGFYFSKPLPVEEFISYISKREVASA